MTLTSCVSKLLGSGGFCSVESCVALWSRFVVLAVIGGSVTGLGVLDLVLRSWVGVFSWLGVCGADCVCVGVVQSGVSVGGAQSFRSSVTIFLNICFLSWLTSFLSWSVGAFV